MKTISRTPCGRSLVWLWFIGAGLLLMGGLSCPALLAEDDTPAVLVRRLPVSTSALPPDRQLEERILKLGDQALPALEQELRLGIKFKELNVRLQGEGSRRAAVVGVLIQMTGDKATDLLVRSLADPPDNYGMRYVTLKALADRTLSRDQIMALLRNHEPEIALAGIAHAKRAPASPEVNTLLEALFDSEAAARQFKNEYGVATATAETLWEVRLQAGQALHKDMLPEIRSKAQAILADLKAESLNPTRPDDPVRMGMLSEAENKIGRHLSRLATFGEPVKDLVAQAAASAEGDYAKVLEMALVRLGDRTKVSRVAASLTDSPSPTIRACAALTLRLSRDRSVIPALRKALRDPYQRRDGSDVGPRDRLVYPVRMLAADALIELGENAKEVRESMR
jgi:hypothetical protein